jgi:hypothetical protein
MFPGSQFSKASLGQCFKQLHTKHRCSQAKRRPEGRLTKISQFELSQVTDEQVLRFQIPVKNVLVVDVCQAPQKLKHEKLEEMDIILKDI